MDVTEETSNRQREPRDRSNVRSKQVNLRLSMLPDVSNISRVFPASFPSLSLWPSSWPK